MIEQGRLEEANTLYTRLICVGEAGLKHEDGWQERLNYVNGLTDFLVKASHVSRRLHRVEESEARLTRALAIYDGFEAEMARRFGGASFQSTVRPEAYNKLGITYSEMGRHAEAERALRKAIAGFKALPPDVRAEKEENLSFTIESLVIVLRDQGKTAAMQQLDEAELHPFLVRQVLGSSAADAQVRAFDLRAALTVPLPDYKSVDALMRWQGLVWSEANHKALSPRGLVIENVGPRRQLIPLKRRILQRGAARPEPPEHHLRGVHPPPRALRRPAPGGVGAPVQPAARRPAQRGRHALAHRPRRAANKLGHRMLEEAVCSGEAGKLRRAEAVLRQAVEETDALGGEQPFPAKSVSPGDLGRALLALGDRAAAEAMFEKALAAAQAVWGEELLGSGVERPNGHCVDAYLEMLEDKLSAVGTPDTALTARCTWLGALQAELRGQEHALADEILEELRATVCAAKGVATTPATVSKKQLQRLEVQHRKAEACPLKKQRALGRAERGATAAAAAAAERRERSSEEDAADEEDGAGAAGDEEAVDEEQEAADAKEEEEKEKEKEECPMCLLELGEAGEGPETLVACGHAFHVGCIAVWKETCRRKELALTCPYCREKMK